jgi:S-formylglutathione hydrolase FrmB
MIHNTQIGEMIAVFVDGSNRLSGSQYRSSITIGDYETYIVKDLVNHIDANYRTIANRNSRGITGISMGGYGAMHLALKYPDVFSVVVSQAGRYDYDSDWWKNSLKAMAFANPKNWAEYNLIDWQTQIRFAYSATVSPNPDNPPFFLNKPFELVNGKAEAVPEVLKQHADSDIVHGDLEQYLKQPIRLAGIKFVHGTADDVTPVAQARGLDKRMTELRVNHVYEEHGGGHIWSTSESLQFLSEHLEGLELLDKNFAVDARGKLATMWGQVKCGR